jgi:16S rRNA (cytosine1402-N4)-methyltransferase
LPANDLTDGDASSPAASEHVPVLLDRVVALLAPAFLDRDAVFVDATLGLGGHSEALIATHPRLTLVGLDRDTEALRRSGERLAPFASRIHLVHAIYDELPVVLADLGIDQVDGVLFDLGVSSLQLDQVDRGFSYARDAPLDMRMDQSTGRTAADVVNGYSVPELARILSQFGEERFAMRIAQAINRERGRAPLNSTARLADLVRDAIPAATRRTGGHPAKRTFQALRIEVNGELEALRSTLAAALDAIRVGGRVVVLSYHSLEDRLVKQQFAALATDQTPPGLPVPLAEHGPQLRLLTRGGETASESEVTANPRSASVRLRAAERVRMPA